MADLDMVHGQVSTWDMTTDDGFSKESILLKQISIGLTSAVKLYRTPMPFLD